jgi:hypothetical protein
MMEYYLLDGRTVSELVDDQADQVLKGTGWMEVEK